MVKVKIIGAGSIGCHHCYACRQKRWDVAIEDIDPGALLRIKREVYPGRYGRWDEEIRTGICGDFDNEYFDVVIVGTPPSYHIDLALIELNRKATPKVVLIEKPLTTPSLKGVDNLCRRGRLTDTVVLVGYNHCLTQNALDAEKYIKTAEFGKPISMNVRWLEHWGGIFGAHPWLAGPHDSYLGSWELGGGSCCEHSHSIHIWQHFARLMGMGKIVEVSAFMDFVQIEKGMQYDRVCNILVKSENGLMGTIQSDVVTSPPCKSLRIQFDNNYLEWRVNFDKRHDSVEKLSRSNDIERLLIEKSRPDDFRYEIANIENLIENPNAFSPIRLEYGLETMMVVAAAFKSNSIRRAVKIDYKVGFCLDALV